MALKLTTTSEAARSNGVKMCVYGRAGAGKTTLCKTLPNPLIISAEGGLLSLADTNIPVIEIESFMDIDDAFRFVTESPEAQQFESIALDSITEIAEQCLSYERNRVKDPRQAYGELGSRMATVIRSFRDLIGKHVYFSAKGGFMKDRNGVSLWGPSMPGNTLKEGLPYFFDEVICADVGENPETQKPYHYLQCRPTIGIEAKDRSGKLEMIEYPDLGNIINKIISQPTAN